MKKTAIALIGFCLLVYGIVRAQLNNPQVCGCCQVLSGDNCTNVVVVGTSPTNIVMFAAALTNVYVQTSPLGGAATWSVNPTNAGWFTQSCGTNAVFHSATNWCGPAVISAICTNTSSVATSTVTIVAAPIVITTPDPVCASMPGNIASVPNAGVGATYVWNVNHGTITAGNGTTQITWTSLTNSPAALSITITNGTCIGSASTNVTVNLDTTRPSISKSNLTVHADASDCSAMVSNYFVTVTDNCGGTVSVAYDPPAPHRFPAGKNQVIVTAADGAGNTNSSYFFVDVLAPSSQAEISTLGAVCINSTNEASVPVAPSGATYYYGWSITNGTIVAGQGTPQITWAAGIQTPVTLGVVVSNAIGCSGSDWIDVSVLSPPVAQIEAPSTVCGGSMNNHAVATSAGPYAIYSWSITNGWITSDPHEMEVYWTSATNGPVKLFLTVANAPGCSTTTSNSIDIVCQQDDADGDGLLDVEEPTYQTDPYNPDTDEDGLFDGEEVLVFGTDPLNRDTDCDGDLDGFEVENGTDPLINPLGRCCRTYTVDEDFDEGIKNGVHHLPPDRDQLQLFSALDFSYVYIAASDRGTIVRIDVDTGETLGEYWTSPDPTNSWENIRDPSRTTVDKLGNVWVTNRAETREGQGSVARVGVVRGGIRGHKNANGDFVPNPYGEYLKGPFEYCTCEDRHGTTVADDPDGLIKTSMELGDILPWSNTGGVDSAGGVATAEDECIINYTRVAGSGARTVAIDANNDVWVGGYRDGDHEKLNGVTGLPIPGTLFNMGCGGYGGLVDHEGNLWSSAGLLRYNPATGVGVCFGNNYGIGIDPNNGHLWASSANIYTNAGLLEFDSSGTVFNQYSDDRWGFGPVYWGQGLAVDGNSHVWVTEGFFASEIHHFAPDPHDPQRHIQVGDVAGFSGATGVAVDRNGKIWIAERGNRASRIDPNAGPVGNGGYRLGQIDLSVNLHSGAGPYNYSDMTGFVSQQLPGSWTVVHDSGEIGLRWGKVSWNASTPGTSTIAVKVRAADTTDDLTNQTYVVVSNAVGLVNGPTGRFIEIAASLTAGAGRALPVLYDLTVCPDAGLNLPPQALPNQVITNTVSGGVIQTVPVERFNNNSFDPEGQPIVLSLVPSTVLPVGTNLVTLVVTDPRGQSGTSNTLAIVLDLELPSITCPVDVTAYSEQKLTIVTNQPPLSSCILGANLVSSGFYTNTYYGPTYGSGTNLAYNWSITGNGTLVGVTTNRMLKVRSGNPGTYTLSLTYTNTSIGFGGVCQKPVIVATNQVVSILGGQLFSRGGEITVEVLTNSALYVNELSLFTSVPPYTNVLFIAKNTESNKVVNIGSYPPGAEVMFGIYVTNTAKTYFMGPAHRNRDNRVHANVQNLADGVADVGVEDLTFGDPFPVDWDYDDTRFRFSPVDVTPMTTNICSTSRANVVLGWPTVSDNHGIQTLTNDAPSELPVGDTLVHWSVVDLSGNTNDCTQTVQVLASPPMFLCPPTVIVTVNPGTNVATGVALGTPITTTFCEPYSLFNDAPAAFPLGTNEVTWTAITASSNQFDCTQQVIVFNSETSTTFRVVLIRPLDQEQFAFGVPIPLVAQASTSTVAISKVEFFAGANKLGEDTTAPSPYLFNWTNAPAGTHTLRAAAINTSAHKTNWSTDVIVYVGDGTLVNLTAPTNQALFAAGANITLDAEATGGTITNVEFFANNVKVGEDVSAPYSVTWSNVAARTYALVAKAWNSLGKTGSSSPVTIIVNGAPDIWLLQPPTNGVIVVHQGRELPILAAARDADGQVTNVAFFVNLTSNILNDATSPYGFNWPSPAIGTTQIVAVAYDNHGFTATSGVAQVRVNTLPGVNLLSPTNTALYQAGVSIPVVANASDPDGNVVRVDFVLNGEHFVTDTTGSTNLFGFNSASTNLYGFAWDHAAPGTHTLVAQATDNDGGVSNSAPITFRVNGAPAVSLTSPIHDTRLQPGAEFVITATFNDDDVGGMITNAALYKNGALLHSTTPNAASGSISLTTNFTNSGSYNFTAVVRDNDGAARTSTPVQIVISAPPSITLTNPVGGEVYRQGEDIFLGATASDPEGKLWKVEFFAGQYKLYQTTNTPFSFTWANAPVGEYLISARAIDLDGLATLTPAVAISVVSSNDVTAPTVGITPFNSPVSDTLTVEVSAADANGIAQIELSVDGSLLAFNQNETSLTYDLDTTTLANGEHTLQAIAYDAAHNSATSNFIFTASNLAANFQVSPSRATASQAIITNSASFSSSVTWYLVFTGLTPEASTIPTITGTGSSLSTNLDTSSYADGMYSVTLSNASFQITRIFYIDRTQTSVAAAISNLDDSAGPVLVTNGLFVVRGTADDADTTDTVSYRIGLYSFDGTFVRDLTPTPLSNGFHVARVSAGGVLGTNDLTTVENGTYEIRLSVRSFSPGNPSQTEQLVISKQIALDSQLKIGQFSFSQQDLIVPVSGIPLTVIRTYNSLNPRSGDFGYSWTYAIKELDLVFNEEREETDSLEGSFSMRVGNAYGGRDVTLTMPDTGQRVTFRFSLEYKDYCMCYHGRWIAPPGVNASLRAVDRASDGDHVVLQTLPYLYWGNAQTAPENYDFAGFILTTRDGTQYVIKREYQGWHSLPEGEQNANAVEAYGDAYLSQIILRDGNTLSFTDNGVIHSAHRSLVFTRDGQGRITAIHDPAGLNSLGQTNGPAAMKYEYDGDGNLTKALRLIATTPTPEYSTNAYFYDDARFPHYITEIKDPRGLSPLRNLYDGTGRLTGVIDAFGKTNTFVHDLVNHIETITNRLGQVTKHFYDDRGNVTNTVDALNQSVKRTYDLDNNVLSESNAVGVTTYTYDADGNRTSITDPLTNTTVLVYDVFGNVLAITNALGQVTRQVYDSVGNLTQTIQELGGGPTVTTRYEYDVKGNRKLEEDALGNQTKYLYTTYGDVFSVVDAFGKGTAYTYDANGNPLTETVKRTRPDGTVESLVTTHIYDAANRLVKTIDPLGYTNEVVYNEIGTQAAVIDKLGRTTSYEYDAGGRLERVTYPDTTFEEYGYDAEGRRITTTDRASRATTNTYDAVGRQILTIYPGGATVSNTYDAVGRLIATTDARTNTTAFVYDAAGRRTAMTNALQQVTQFNYDAVGNLLKTTDALSRVVSNVYDGLSRRVAVVYPDTTTQQTVYDAIGRRIAELDQAGLTNWFGYDALGRLASVTNALGKVTRYEYDEVGNLIRQIDANTHTNQFEYDKLGRRTKRTLPGNQSETFVYDAVGNLTQHTDFNGLLVTNSYDAVNRLLSRWQGPTKLLEFAYYPTGTRSNMVDASGPFTYTYDVRDRLVTNATPQGTLAYEYDFQGNLIKIQSGTANGTLVTYEYDALNRLTNAVDARLSGNQNTRYTFDAVGSLQRVISPNTVTNTYSYNSLNRLTNLTCKINTTVLGDFSYLLGVAGNRTNLTETVNSVSRNYAWSYDATYRLTNEVASGTSPTGNLGYGLDDVGNRVNRTGSIGSLGAQSFSYNANDQLTGDLYDANGNTTNSAGNTFRYDHDNRLTNAVVSGAPITIVYDGDGNRVKKVAGGVTTLYLVDTRNPSGYAQVLEELTVSGSATNLARAYTYGLDLISQRDSGGTVRFYGYDGHGSTRFLTDSSGNVTDTYAYDAYGNVIASTGSTPNSYRHMGEQYDADLNLYYHRARYRSQETGRFWTRDTFDGSPGDPLSLHRYLAFHADPANRIDPSGHTSLLEIQLVSAIVQTIIFEDLRGAKEGLMTAQSKFGTSQELAKAIKSLQLVEDAQTVIAITQLSYGLVQASKALLPALKRFPNLLKSGLAFFKAGVKTLDDFETGGYRTLQQALREAGISGNAAGRYQAHHLLERRFAERLGYTTSQIDQQFCVATEFTFHNDNITQPLRSAIGYDGSGATFTTSSASFQKIWDETASAYRDLGVDQAFMPKVKELFLNAPNTGAHSINFGSY